MAMIVDDDLSSRSGECFRGRLPDASTGSGDESDLSVEIKSGHDGESSYLVGFCVRIEFRRKAGRRPLVVESSCGEWPRIRVSGESC